MPGVCEMGLLESGIRELWDTFCNKRQYRLVPTIEQVHVLMGHFAAEAVRHGTAGDEAAHIEALDNAYKCFGILIYYDIPPTEMSYEPLIVSGLPSAEGWRRSEITGREQLSLGLTLTPKAAGALLVGYVKVEDLERAIWAMERLANAERLSTPGAEGPNPVYVEALAELTTKVAGTQVLRDRLKAAVARSWEAGGIASTKAAE